MVRPSTSSPTESYVRAVREAPESDTAIVFVHGVFGDGDDTFRAANNTYWPDLVASDPLFKSADIFVYGYDSPWTEQGLTIDQLADDMSLRMQDVELFDRYPRIVFVCHSMGGLVTRAFMTKYQRLVADKVLFLYFFSTPASGSSVATLADLFLPNTQLANMNPDTGDAFLRELQSRWLGAGFGRTIASYCAHEVRPTYGVLIVSWASAFGLCNEGVIAIDADHMGVVKPGNIEATPHVALRTAFMNSATTNARAPIRLVASPMFAVEYQPEFSGFAMRFDGAIRAQPGASDVITDIYARMESIDDSAPVPFSANEVDCVRSGQPLALPFIFGGSEVSCTFRKTVGDITGPALLRPGNRRVTITFETDEKRGHTAQYCFDFDEAFVAKGGPRRFLYAACQS